MSIEEYAKLVQSLQQTNQGLERALQEVSETLKALRDDLAKRDAEIAELRRMLFGPRREKPPPKEREVAKRDPDIVAKKVKAQARRQAVFSPCNALSRYL